MEKAVEFGVNWSSQDDGDTVELGPAVDAIDPDDEGTVLELAGGVWLTPHPDEHLFSAFAYGLGFRVPVTSRTEDLGAVMLVIEHSFD